MPFKRKNEYLLSSRVSFRLPEAVHRAIQAKAETERKSVSDIMRAETIQIFEQKPA